jgi:hypothetical protein
MVCSNTGHGSLAIQNGSTPTTWISYAYTFLATKTAPTLMFGFDTDGTNTFFLDSVSVVDNNAMGNQLLKNPGFENSTSATGWITSCDMITCGANATWIEISLQCASGNCFKVYCPNGRPSITFFSQTFTTISGNMHKISYILKRTSIPSSGIMAFYLDIN